MGSNRVAIISDAKSRRQYFQTLMKDLEALEYMLDHDMFEKDIQRIGFEQELSFVDDSWRPAPVGMEVLQSLQHDLLAPEFGLFNLEINLDPKIFTADCLSETQRDLQRMLDLVKSGARKFGAHPLLVGILPSVRQQDVTMDNLTPLPRYKFLVEELHRARGGQFELHMEGMDELILKGIPMIYEACNTSFQVHLQIRPEDFRKSYNWSMAIAAPVMACCTNSPLLLGRRLWRETRIALYRQTTDTRPVSKLLRQHNQRVALGNGWIKNSVLDVFHEDIARIQPLFQPKEYEDAMEILRSGKIPKLRALSTHIGTSYRWNRACYGITNGMPHLRIENRLIPAGPCVTDQIANAAFWLGLMKGLPPEYANIQEDLDFDYVKVNFLKAARQGLGAHFRWASTKKQITSEDLILKELLPIAKQGLEDAKIDQGEIDRNLGIIEERVKSGKTGSQWLVDCFSKLKKESNTQEALIGTTAVLFHSQQSGQPVHTWDVPALAEARKFYEPYQTVDTLMQTNLYTIRENDLLTVAAKIMHWFHIRHLPVENAQGELVGFLSPKTLREQEGTPVDQDTHTLIVKDIMETNFPVMPPNATTIQAINAMQQCQCDYVPVMENDRLIGIVTEHDLNKVAPNFLDKA